jgi:hypothetical protein
VRLLRLWLGATAVALAAIAAWAFAPMLIFMAALVACLGGVAAGAIWLARRLRVMVRARRLRARRGHK